MDASIEHPSPMAHLELSHDVRNLVTAVLVPCRFLQEEGLAGDPGLGADLASVCGRAADMTDRILRSAEGKQVRRSDLRIADVLADIGFIGRWLVGPQVELVLEDHAPDRVVWAERSELERVLLNLLVNARNALPEGGRITVSAVDSPVAKSLHGPKRAGVSLIVADDGVGMAPDTIARIFEPLFTTRRSEGGMGLGLAIVRQLVQGLGGRVDVESGLGRGTRFSVWLPVRDVEVV